MISRFRLELVSRALARRILAKPAEEDAGELEDQLRNILERGQALRS